MNVDLSTKSPENIKYMIEEITSKLRIVDAGALKPDHFNESSYEDLKQIYEHVNSKNNFSPSEMQAIAEELGNLKK